MLWAVSVVWFAVVVALGWRYLTAPSRWSLVSYVVVGLAGVVAYLVLLLTDRLPTAYTAAMTAAVVVLALASAVWRVRQRRDGGG